MTRPGRTHQKAANLGLRSRFAVVHDTRLHWAEMGLAADSVPLVMLHGLNDWHLTWRRVAPALATKRRLLMPDLAGHGWSERPNASYELAWHSRLIAKWFEAIGLEKVDVLGHSYGGGVAQMLLLECPERIRRLVLVASGGLGRHVGLPLRLAALPLFVERFGQPFMAFGTRLAMNGVLDEEDIAELSAINAEQGSARAFARTVRDVVGWNGQRRLFLERAHELQSLPPIAVFWGDRDKLIRFSDAKAFVESVEGIVFRAFAGSSHFIHHDQPEAFVRAVCEFLDDPSAAATRLRSSASPRFQRFLKAVMPRRKPDAPTSS
jgi:pimeloyl-ACP methyl ester carboxylesterase